MELVRARFGFGKTKIGDVNDDLNEYLHPDQERILALLAATLTLECGLQSWDNVENIPVNSTFPERLSRDTRPQPSPATNH